MPAQSLEEYRPLVPSEQPFEPLPTPSAACKLSVMQVGALQMPGFLFVQGFEGDMYMEDYSFLIEHSTSKKRVLFDLGLRKNLEYTAETKKLFEVWAGKATTSPQDLLNAAGISLDSIDTVIFSHTHFDHVGNLSNFPKSTSLLFGPYSDRSKINDRGKLAASLQVKEDVLEGRKIEDLSETKWQTYGSLRGVDYFGDGSLILLDTPGHMEGHIAALVCVATAPQPLYQLLGGDAAHHISLIDYENPAPIGVYKAKENALSAKKDSEPEALQSFECDIELSYQSMAKLARMDHERNINICLAHDTSLRSVFGEIGSLDKLVSLKGTKEEMKMFKERSREDVKDTVQPSS